MLPVTCFFAGILALFYVLLSLNVIRRRYGARVSIGDGGDVLMQRRIRVHANFAEYIPLALVLMALAEVNEYSETLLNVLGTLLVLGRLLHAYGLLVAETKRVDDIKFRSAGMISTFGVLIALALMNLF